MSEIVLRGYQSTAVASVFAAWNEGARNVCLVAPPGAGKTEMAKASIASTVDSGRKALWVVHQRDLAQQAVARLSATFGHEVVGGLFGGYSCNPSAKIVVATIQSLLRQGSLLSGFGVAYLDECHHYAADAWRNVEGLQRGGFPRVLGGTATPEREDGKPLGDMFERLVVAASYSELISGGYLVKPKIVRPRRYLGGDWAANPIDAWAEYGCLPGIMWLPSVELSKKIADDAVARHRTAASITEDTSQSEREEIVTGFERGTVELITNFSTMLEGIDFPGAMSGTLCRSFVANGTYLQATGRLLRVHPDGVGVIKVIIDLTGCTVRHGLPYQDREYSLDGKVAISGPSNTGTGGGYERHDPEVRNVELVHDFSESDIPARVELPIPDKEWLNAKRRADSQYRDLVKRIGAKAANAIMRRSAQQSERTAT